MIVLRTTTARFVYFNKNFIDPLHFLCVRYVSTHPQHGLYIWKPTKKTWLRNVYLAKSGCKSCAIIPEISGVPLPLRHQWTSHPVERMPNVRVILWRQLSHRSAHEWPTVIFVRRLPNEMPAHLVALFCPHLNCPLPPTIHRNAQRHWYFAVYVFGESEFFDCPSDNLWISIWFLQAKIFVLAPRRRCPHSTMYMWGVALKVLWRCHMF